MVSVAPSVSLKDVSVKRRGKLGCTAMGHARSSVATEVGANTVGAMVVGSCAREPACVYDHFATEDALQTDRAVCHGRAVVAAAAE